MKSKAPLLLMEQMVMLLVFALAAALCLQAFVKSDGISLDSENRDRAAALCQSAAEAVQHCGGNLAETVELLELPYPYGGGEQPLIVAYDETWNCVGVGPDCGLGVAYQMNVQPMDSDVAGLGKASVEAFAWDNGTMKSIFMIEAAWQEPVAAAAAEGEIGNGTAD